MLNNGLGDLFESLMFAHDTVPLPRFYIFVKLQKHHVFLADIHSHRFTFPQGGKMIVSISSLFSWDARQDIGGN